MPLERTYSLAHTLLFTSSHGLTRRAASCSHFQEFRESADFPSGVCADILLGADKGVIDSYLRPTPEQGGFIMAIDADFDPNEPDDERSEESPGYSGVVRVLGSILWDDLGALVKTQTQHLFDVWPLAMNHPDSVYQGPLGKIE